jgi:hypothetical protein
MDSPVGIQFRPPHELLHLSVLEGHPIRSGEINKDRFLVVREIYAITTRIWAP